MRPEYLFAMMAGRNTINVYIEDGRIVLGQENMHSEPKDEFYILPSDVPELTEILKAAANEINKSDQEPK